MMSSESKQSGITGDSDGFAFTTGAHGNRPTYVLTPADDGVELYELAPRNVAEGRQSRHDRKQGDVDVATVDVGEAIQGGDTPDDVGDLDDQYDWNGWCAVEVSTVTDYRLDYCTPLIESVCNEFDIDSKGILVAEGDSVVLPESAGDRLTIAFKTVERMRNRRKIRLVIDKTRSMSLGECYYWHSKIKSPEEPNGATAFRELSCGHLD